jgi:serine/threonine-protein kinase HipA
MDERGVWRVSPAYDLTFSFGPSGEHSTMIMGEGKKPQIEHLLKLAVLGGIKKSKASEIIGQVHSIVRRWEDFAVQAGVSKQQTKRIGETLNGIKLGN